MNPHRTNLALRVAAVGLTAAAPVVVIAGLWAGLDSADATRGPLAVTKSASRVATTAVSVDSFGPALDRPLRPPLDDSAAKPAATPADAAAPGVSPKQLRLVGTIGDAIALLKGPDDAVALVEVGDDVEGADVVAIRDQQVELRLNGRLIRLEKMPAKPDGGEITIR